MDASGVGPGLVCPGPHAPAPEASARPAHGGNHPRKPYRDRVEELLATGLYTIAEIVEIVGCTKAYVSQCRAMVRGDIKGIITVYAPRPREEILADLAGQLEAIHQKWNDDLYKARCEDPI